MPRNTTPPDPPGFTPEQVRWLLSTFTAQSDDLARATALDSTLRVFTTRVDARAGQIVRVSPPAAGQQLILPPARRTRPGDEVVALVENPSGTLTVAATPDHDETGQLVSSTVNGLPRVSFTLPGEVRFRSNGADRWTTPSEHPSEVLTAAGVSVVGATGARGATGAQGPAGVQGIPGDQGEPGADGAPGQNGAPGAAGATGSTGPQGVPGEQGPQGDQGDQGPAGPSSPGTPGATGATGPQGIQGPIGADGEKGEQGDAGPQGPGGTDLQTWAQTLARGRNTGGLKPGLDSGDYIDVGTTGGTLPGTGDIRGRAGLTVRSTGTLALTSDTADLQAIATAGAFSLSGAGTGLVQAGTSLQILAATTATVSADSTSVRGASALEIRSPQARFTSGGGTGGGYMTCVESAASTPTIAAGEGCYSVANGAACIPRFTDDENQDWFLGYSNDVSVVSLTPVAVTNAQVNILSATYAANTWRQGAIFECYLAGKFNRGATATVTNVQLQVRNSTVILDQMAPAAMNITNGTAAGLAWIRLLLQVPSVPGAAVSCPTQFFSANDCVTSGSVVEAAMTGLRGFPNISTNAAVTLNINIIASATVAGVTFTPSIGWIKRK